MSSKPTLYGNIRSPPVRAVILTFKALNLEYDYVVLEQDDNLKPEFLKMNPQHTMPTIVDEGKSIWDSHAICAYLVRKYGKTDELYPKDFHQRAVVDQRLYYEDGVLFTAARQLFMAEKEEFANKLKALTDSYDMLEIFLADHDYIAGNNLTIADFSIATTVTSMEIMTAIEAKKHPKLSAWLRRMQNLPYYSEVNDKGLAAIKEVYKSRIPK